MWCRCASVLGGVRQLSPVFAQYYTRIYILMHAPDHRGADAWWMGRNQRCAADTCTTPPPLASVPRCLGVSRMREGRKHRRKRRCSIWRVSAGARSTVAEGGRPCTRWMRVRHRVVRARLGASAHCASIVVPRVFFRPLFASPSPLGPVLRFGTRRRAFRVLFGGENGNYTSHRASALPSLRRIALCFDVLCLCIATTFCTYGL